MFEWGNGGRRARPALVALAGGALALASVVFLGAPRALAGTPAGADPIVEFLKLYADAEGLHVVVDGDIVRIEDPSGDVSGKDAGGNDIVGAGYAWLPKVEGGLLDRLFKCGQPTVACDKAATDRYANGAWIFHGARAAPYDNVPAGTQIEFGPQLALTQYPAAPAEGDNAFSLTSHNVITRVEGGKGEMHYFAYGEGAFAEFSTQSRSTWTGTDWFTIIPVDKEIRTDPTGWDIYSFINEGTQSGVGRDTIRGFEGAPLIAWAPSAPITFLGGIAPTAPATAAPTAGAGTTTSPSTAGPTPVASGSGSPTGTGAFDPLLLGVLFVIALLVVMLGWWRLRRRGAVGG